MDKGAVLQPILDIALDAVVVMDAAGAVADWNGRAEAMFGWTHAEAVGRRMADMIIPPEHRASHEQGLQRLLETGQGNVLGRQIGITALRRSGEIFPVELAITRASVAGEMVFLGFIRDISERRRREARLRASEARLQLALDAGRMAVWSYDVLSQTVTSSPDLNRLLGFPTDYAPTVDEMNARYCPGERERLRAAAKAALERNERFFEAELRCTRLDGVLIWVLLRAELSLDADGAVAGVLGVGFDITPRKENELALRENQVRLREANEALEARVDERTRQRDRLWDLSEDLLVLADGAGHLLRISPSWTRLLGHSEETMMARPGTELVHPDDLEATRNAILHMQAEKRPASFENRMRDASGAWRWIAWTLTPEPGSDRMTGIGRDVTAAKARQAELEIAQEALRQSQKLEAMGQLTGGVAHDFNNLLTPIIGSLDMLYRRGVGGPREQRLIDGALQSAERAKTLVQRLLAFARRQPLQPGAVDVPALVTGMSDLIASTSGPQIRVMLNTPPGLPPAQADANQLEMAILNLSVNARDAMPDGGVLTIAVAEDVAAADHRANLTPGRYIHLSVADTGQGMDESTLGRAIEPFFSTKGVGKGTGLGLSMVHGLASQLGGALALSSRPGLGTLAELWLPVAETPTETHPAVLEAAPRAGVGRALLVDDEDLVRISTADMLTDLGYEVVEAASGEEALRLLDAGLRIEVLITDHLMAGMTGVELARALRQQRPSAPVLIVSGFAEAEGVAPDLPRLTKPFRQADLAASLAALVASDPS